MHWLAFLWVNFHTWSLFSIELVKYNCLWNPNWILFYLRFFFHLFDSLKRYAFKTWFSSHEIFSFLFNQYVIPFIGFLKIYTYWGFSFIPVYIYSAFRILFPLWTIFTIINSSPMTMEDRGHICFSVLTEWRTCHH